MPRNKNRSRQRFRLLTAGEESKYLPDQRRLNNKANDFCLRCGRNLKFYTCRTGQLCQICSRDSKNLQNEFPPPSAQSAPIYYPSRLNPSNYSYEAHENQIFSRDSKKLQDEFPPSAAQSARVDHPPKSDPANYSYENHEVTYYQNNDHFSNQEEPAYPDSWQRKIYFSDDAPETSENYNDFEDSQDFQYESQLQRNQLQRRETQLQRNQLQRHESQLQRDPLRRHESQPQRDPLQRYESQLQSYRNINDTQPSFPTYSSYESPNWPSTSVPVHYKGENKRKKEPKDGFSKRIKAETYGSNSQFGRYDQLSNNILLYFGENIQTAEIFARKMALRSRLEQIIQRKFSGCGVFVFGSSMTGFATKSSDLDLSLMFYDAKIVKNRVIRLLWELRSLLSRHTNFTKIQLIRAKVSILKFRDTLSGFDVDLNINNPTGIRNSQLLRSYARLDDRVQPLVLAIKFWAREHRINDAKNGTLSSYCLGLMLLHYLQCGCKPPVLPSLQVLQPDKYSPNSDIRSLELDEVLPDFVSANNENVGELLVGFLRYYSKQFNFDEKRISVRMGCVLPRVDKMLTKEKELRHFIDIEEPFEQINTARAVNNPKKAAFIESVFHNSYNSVVQRGSLGLM